MDLAVLLDEDGRKWIADVPVRRRERIRGLLGRGGLPGERALLLRGTRSVHTFGMRFPIQVAWLDEAGRVVAVRRLAPARLALPRRRSRHVLECADGRAPIVGSRLRELPVR